MESTSAIKGWLARILRRFTDLVFDLRHLRYSGHLARVLKYVRASYREPVSLAGAAADAGLSAGYLSRIFNQEMHTSFSAYVNAVRIQEAERILRTSPNPVSEAGSRAGFPDHSYFTQVFRKQTGVSPTEYRDRYSTLRMSSPE
jgi:two-component system, response regulator YesN